MKKSAIIITTLNGASKGPVPGKWLHEAIESAIDQNGSDHLVVMFSDGSTDKTTNVILEKYGAVENVKTFVARQNRGIGYGFNYAAELAFELGADWVFPMGDDDLARPDWLSYVAHRLALVQRVKGYRLDAIGQWMSFIDAAGNLRTEKAGKETEPEKIRICLSQGVFQTGVLGFSREAWLQLGGYDEEIKWSSDLDIALRAIRAGMKLGVAPKILYDYRIMEMGNTWGVSYLRRSEHEGEFAKLIENHRKLTNPLHDLERKGMRGDRYRNASRQEGIPV